MRCDFDYGEDAQRSSPNPAATGSSDARGCGADVVGNVHFLRKHAVLRCVGKAQQYYDVLRGFALSGTAIHGKCFSLEDIQQSFGDSVQW